MTNESLLPSGEPADEYGLPPQKLFNEDPNMGSPPYEVHQFWYSGMSDALQDRERRRLLAEAEVHGDQPLIKVYKQLIADQEAFLAKATAGNANPAYVGGFQEANKLLKQRETEILQHDPQKTPDVAYKQAQHELDVLIKTNQSAQRR